MKSSTIRKEQSENILGTLNVPINVQLPLAENEDEVSLRTKEEIINRIIPLSIVSAKALKAPKAEIKKFINKYNANELFTEEEQKFISTWRPKQNDLIAYSWKLECIWVLLWSVNLISEIDTPADMCDVDLVFETVLNHSRKELLNMATLKPINVVLDNLDFIYRAHWAVREAQLNHLEIPPALNEGVVYERHYALNWLVNYMKQEWEEISTDT
ncbi:DUF4272 domain-containing protein [Peribacillus sp. R9-11]|uniref:DUF4272 domain-containing protein n=1 Tax=Peribacillus sp. R9-11 TaxID=3073271 RepID=UPI00286942DD|nr:DUF4272 domain-containing protein [Peribacillus sp. R9-11]WMX54538.1 DUF4272 domain-containing protein [Peribacillus sp. R9-11]